jgi:hypothetical protein
VVYLIPFVEPGVLAGDGLATFIERYHTMLRQHGVDDHSLPQLGRDQVLATTEVMQVGLATMARRARPWSDT